MEELRSLATTGKTVENLSTAPFYSQTLSINPIRYAGIVELLTLV